MTGNKIYNTIILNCRYSVMHGYCTDESAINKEGSDRLASLEKFGQWLQRDVYLV